MTPTSDDAAPATAAPGATDGRRLRRDRNREAVVRALLELYNEGNLDPSTDEVAARSGVSARSLFRYFDDVDDLCNAAIDQQLRDLAHLLPIDVADDAPLEIRIRAVVRQRSELFEAIESAATVSRLRAPFQLSVADRLTENRAALRRQLATLFAAELARTPASERAGRLATIDVMTSFEAWRLLRDDQRFSRAEAARALTDALAALLAGDGDRSHRETSR